MEGPDFPSRRPVVPGGRWRQHHRTPAVLSWPAALRRLAPGRIARTAGLLAGLGAGAVFGAGDEPRASGPVPERIVLSLTAAPATSVAITWRTTRPVANPTVQYTRAAASARLAETARTAAARTETVAIDASTTLWHHSVVLEGLEPDTLHAYRVGDGTTWSEWNQVRTAQTAPAPFRFLYFGDPQNDVKEYCTRVFRAAFARAPDSAFYLIVGDMVTATIVDEQWGELCYALTPLAQMVPGLTSPGNHDYGQFLVRGQKVRTASPLFRAHFTQPENGPAGLEETAYHVDVQGVRLVCLNGNERISDQVAWLDALLARNPNRWTIVFMHQPVYSTGKNRDNPKLREALVPLYDKYAVDLVLQGHDHSYGRTHKLRAGVRVADHERGTVYAVSATGPKFYPVNPQHAALMAKIDTGLQLYQIISIRDRSLRYEAWTVTGELHDSFELEKAARR